jgi:DNA polymerase-2
MLRRSPEGPGGGRLYFVGRLESGKTFAAVVPAAKTCLGFHVRERDLPRCKALLSRIPFSPQPPLLEPFYRGEDLAFLRFSHLADRSAAYKILSQGSLQSPDGGEKPAESFLIERRIRGWMEIAGQPRPGKLVDLVFIDPELSPWFPPASLLPPLRVASIDIETDTRNGSILAAALSWAESGDLNREFGSGKARGQVRVLGAGPAGERDAGEKAAGGELIFHPGEDSLLRALVDDIRALDPDVLTGWNFLDFDFPRIADRCARYRIPLLLGRSREEAKFFAGEPGWGWRRRSAAALVPGRQVLDALRVVRAGGQGILSGMDEGGSYGTYSLESVSRRVLGEGKLAASSGEAKIAELEALYARSPGEFGAYCYRDSELVLRILAATGLFRLTLERACLTGVSLDKAWTSVASFERIYGMELRRKGIAPPPDDPRRQVSGAAGGTVLEPLPGFFNNIAVFDFRSLYPTVMLSFNIDPLAHARPEGPANPEAAAGTGSSILAPNGAAFSRSPGLLPGLIAEYFAARREAIDRGDGIAAQVYKILMNSFYGVLGTASCRYGRTELAGAITSFARKWLLASRDWFSARGRRVIYGDTDSLFVESGLDDRASYGDFSGLCGELARELNRCLAERIRDEYGLESFIELRFEKAYRRFFIPALRNIFPPEGEEAGASLPEEGSGKGAEDPAPLRAGVLHSRGSPRGRAKGYGGYLIPPDGGRETVEVKGMEAVRSDSTPLARRIQLELLELVFSGAGEAEFRRRVAESLEELRAGKLDGELVYRKRLSRPPEEYTASTPPQVKAARALGWKGRRGTVEYVWTLSGAEPASLPHGPLDYGHYASAQLLPVAKSIAGAAGWNMEDLFGKSPGRKAEPSGRQIEFGF